MLFNVLFFLFSVIRRAGAYGEVPVDWDLASDHAVSGQVADTFNMTRGTIMFDDGARMRNITLRVLSFLGAFYCHQIW